jgi:nuclear transport factor 2 (NTF2) superfamily protein
MTQDQMRLKVLFENLNAQAIAEQVAQAYAPEAVFRDPFNQVQGRAKILTIYSEMFAQLQEARFEVTEVMGEAQSFYMRWDFIFRHASMPQALRVDGVTRMTLDESGLITEHLDFWDAGSGLLSHLPWVGWWMRKLYAKLAH